MDGIKTNSTNNNNSSDNLECSICGKHLPYPYALDNHIIRAHNGCPECKEICVNEQALIKHIAFIHGGFNCPICDNFSQSLQKLRDHVRRVHRDHRYYCISLSCKCVFKTRQEYEEHQERIHKPPNKRYKLIEKARKEKQAEHKRTWEERNKRIQEEVDREEKYRYVYEIDLHDLFFKEALRFMEDSFSKNPETKEFKIIHGFSHGDKLLKFVRSEDFRELFVKKGYRITVKDKTHQVYTIIKVRRVRYNGKSRRS